MSTSTPHGGPVLEAVRLNKIWKSGIWPGRRRQQQVLFDVSIALHPAQTVALVGESGSGKSTVAKLLTRLWEPSSGELLLAGRNVLLQEPKPTLSFRRQVQLVQQDPFASLNPVNTVRYHLERPLLRHERVTQASVEGRISELLGSVGLRASDADKYPSELSGGQRQRVAFARALAVEPRVVIADEPTSMLDVSVRMGVLNLMQELKVARSLAWLYVTHDLASARYVADRICVLFGGHLVEAGPAEELIQAPQHPYTQLLLASVPGAPPQAQHRPLRAEPLSAPGTERGCPFAPRCPEAHTPCFREVPVARRVGRSLPTVASDWPSGNQNVSSLGQSVTPDVSANESPAHWVQCHAR